MTNPRWSALVTSVLFGTGCIQVFSLDKTTQADPSLDTDMDGVADALDNCPATPNEDQSDRDDDGRGDACDTCDACVACAVGPEHDEDGDTISDGCDNCPLQSNPAGANVDGDDLGDACDPDNATQQHRLLFDGFGSIGADWSKIGDWSAESDAATTLEGAHPFGYRLTSAKVPIQSTGFWSAQIAIDVPLSPDQTDSIGLSLVNAEGTTQWGCTVIYQDGAWNLTNGIPEMVNLAPGRAILTLGSLRNGDSTRLCRLGTAPEKTSGSAIEAYPMGVQLFANRTTRFAYVEVVQ